MKYSEKIGELRKVRFGFQDTSVNKAWYIRKVSCILLVYHLKEAFIVYDLTISEYLVKV